MLMNYLSQIMVTVHDVENLEELVESGSEKMDVHNNEETPMVTRISITSRYLMDTTLMKHGLFCTQADDKGNLFGLGRLAETISKGERKESFESSSSSSILEMHQKLEEARRKIVKQDEDHKEALSRLSSMEQVLTFLKKKDPDSHLYLPMNKPSMETVQSFPLLLRINLRLLF